MSNASDSDKSISVSFDASLGRDYELEVIESFRYFFPMVFFILR